MINAINRRDFLAIGGALLASRSSAADLARIDILPGEPIGVISPNIYGHFTEHIGGVIYDGVWVGADSKIPNVNGIRKALIDHLKLMKAAVIRWPGGCFADSYNWRDGVGPRDRRPTRSNFWANNSYLAKAPDGPQKYEPNTFGTNDFGEFCRLAGAEPYLAGNVRSLTAKDLYEWVDYCNAPAGATTLSQLRAEGGSRHPFNVRYWGVGNESWGCGGNFTAAEYAVEFRRYAEWLPNFGVNLSLVASGPNAEDYSWTRDFFAKLTEKNKAPLHSVFGAALHYYCGSTGDHRANVFSEDDWYKLLANANRMEELVTRHWQIMGEVDTTHRVKLVVDEWGAWHQTDPSIAPDYLWGYYPTLRDALISGITLDIFNRHSEKVIMANAAQLINNIHCSFVAAGDKFVVTPNFHVFRMYSAHQGNTSVRAVFSSPPVSGGPSPQLPALRGSCSMRGNHVVLTVVNSDIKTPQTAAINIGARQISNVRATVLTSGDIHARNTFDQPNGVEPVTARVTQPLTTYRFVPASVTALEFDLT
jgi:alpha-N-arabinofuranosidase